ncbi:hypothetical protein SAMN05421788_115108 [Filimonas lacunae]|uniref:3-keto-disaccharide hydrolase domain-containing protein n=1 Tax=Filimonas lacunae TaxID=477680 RepID=A0A173MBU8_9BACT|nr:hypothetical protein [Filimonas lacunae]BAV05053.1 hypothetical protein FLA_1058 [Filimonas lacunae]SIT34314.1 hypothetical protein SAMN05421788_115108 [Filimonas lacunae]
MKFKILAFSLFFTSTLLAQNIELTKENTESCQVGFSFEKSMGKGVVRVVKDSLVKGADEPTYVKIKGVELKNGVIEFELLSRLLPGASDSARGFIGIAFRIAQDNKQFESFYLRPANARVLNQIRRNHSTQYFSYPDYKFDRLRREAPEKYESYADMELDKWIRVKVFIQNAQAMLYLNGQLQPALVVNDLKLGGDVAGGIGFWVENGTEGFFRNLSVSKL